MKFRASICGLLLHMLLIFAAPAPAAQTLAPIAGSDPAASAFDYDQALAISQAAIGQRVADIEFTAADGRKLRLDDFRGKPLVVSMVFTSCYEICPMTTRFLSGVVERRARLWVRTALRLP